MPSCSTQIAVGYARVSSREQAEEGASLDMQEERIASFCSAKGWKLARVYSDSGQSAKTLDRPALQTMIRDIPSVGASVIVILKLDRLTRSVKDLATLVEEVFSSIGLAAVEESLDSSSAGGRMVLNLLASLGQWEREVIGERTSAAMRYRRDVEGRWMGRPPFGFGIDSTTGRLIQDCGQMKTIAAMKRSHRAGRSLSWIAKRHGVSKSLVHKLVNTHLRTLKAAAMRQAGP